MLHAQICLLYAYKFEFISTVQNSKSEDYITKISHRKYFMPNDVQWWLLCIICSYLLLINSKYIRVLGKTIFSYNFYYMFQISYGNHEHHVLVVPLVPPVPQRHSLPHSSLCIHSPGVCWVTQSCIVCLLQISVRPWHWGATNN